MLPKSLPYEISHSFVDLFAPFLINFGAPFEQNVGPFDAPNGPTQELEVTGDCTKLIYLDNIYTWRLNVEYFKRTAMTYDMTQQPPRIVIFPVWSTTPFILCLQIAMLQQEAKTFG